MLTRDSFAVANRLVCCVVADAVPGMAGSQLLADGSSPLLVSISNESLLIGDGEPASTDPVSSIRCLGICYYAPAPSVGALSDDARLTSDCLSRTLGLSRGLRRLRLAQK